MQDSTPTASFGRIIGIAVGYLVAAKLGILLAIPPGYATAFWPASGVALIGVLLFSPRVWPGIWLGSFLVNVLVAAESESGITLHGLVIATGLGIGASIQGVAGGYIVRRWVGFPCPLTRELEVAKFLTLGGPVSCVVAATWGVVVLLLAGAIVPSEFWFTWFTWWVGDTLGVIVVAPILLTMARSQDSIWRHRRATVGLPLLLTCGAVVACFLIARRMDERSIRATFDLQTHALRETLHRSLAGYVSAVRSVQHLFSSVSTIDRAAFNRFTRPILEAQVGVRGLGWDVLVRDEQREPFEKSVQNEGFAGFQITELDSHARLVRRSRSDEYVVVHFLEPRAGNEPALGFDVSSDPARRRALDASRATGSASATARITLVQEMGGQPGFLMFDPVFNSNESLVGGNDDRPTIRGFAVGVFRVCDVVNASLGGLNREGINIRLIEQSASGGGTVIGSLMGDPSDAEPIEAGQIIRRTHAIDIAGLDWSMECSATRSFFARGRGFQVWAVLAFGMLFSGLLGAFLLIQTGRAETTEELVSDRTRALKQSNESLASVIESRRQTEATLRSNEELLRVFVKFTPAAVAMFDNDMRYLLASDGWAAAYRLGDQSLMGRHHYDVFPEIRQMPRWIEIHQRCLHGARERCEEDRFPRADGTIDWVKWEIHPWRRAEGGIGGIIMFTEVITDRKLAEEAFRKEEARFRTLALHSPVGIFQTDSEGNYLFVNQRWCEMAGMSAQESMGEGWARALHPEDHDWVLRKWKEAVREGEPFSCEYRFRTPTGVVTWLTANAVALRGADGALSGFLGTCTNFTAQRKLEEESRKYNEKLADTNRLSVLGEMATGLAHEIKQPLSAIVTYTDVCLALLSSQPSNTMVLRGAMQKALEQAHRASDIIDRIRSFVKKGQVRVTHVQVNEIIQQAAESAEYVTPRQSVTIRCDLAPGLPMVRVDRLQIEQVLWNLLNNAWDAIAEGAGPGDLLISTSTDDDRVQVAVRDNGPGLKTDAVETVFAPFYSTKSGGMGMGLSISRSIIEAHGGRLWAANNPDQGATFFFTLPVASGEKSDA